MIHESGSSFIFQVRSLPLEPAFTLSKTIGKPKSQSKQITLLVKVSQGHNYQIATNKTCMAHEVLFLQIVHMSGQTAANKLSTGHRVLFLQIVHASGETGANKLSMGYGSHFL